MKGKIPVVPALVVGLILISMVYGYFLPDSDKCNLFPDLAGCDALEGEALFTDSPGLLKETETAARYTFTNIQLFRRDSLEVDTIFDEVSTKKSWFSSIPVKTEFQMQEGGKNIKLFIFVNSAKGALKVKVNGRNVARLRGEGLQEVLIPLKLFEKDSVIELKSSTPLLPLWANKHTIGKVSLREEYIITNNRISEDLNIKQDIGAVDRAILKFDTACFSDEDISISVNGEKVFEGKLCEGFEKDIIEYLKEEENEITFASEGNYYIEDIVLDVDLKQKSWPVYYFDIEEERLEEGFVNLKMQFANTGEKKLTLYLNGESLAIETRDLDYETTINKYLVDGQNDLILIPETELTLDKIEIL
ncbi:hypothetical protein ACFLZZ_02200 [Nanoarchaeota archaeon]